MRLKQFILLLFILVPGWWLNAGINRPPSVYYTFQVSATFGVSRISAPLTDFPGSHWGASMRYKNHTFGFRREWDGEFLKMWGEPLYYSRTGMFYEWTASRQSFQWGPQIAAGIIEYNSEVAGTASERKIENGFYAELAINGLLNARGNGIGVKGFVNFNRFTIFAGATVYLQIGYAWNGNQKE